MSWLYSQALLEDYSEDTDLDGELSVLSSGIPTQRVYSSVDRTTEFSKPSLSGMTFRHLTGGSGEGVLTSFLADFPAKTYPLPEKVKGSMGRGLGCGVKWRALSARFSLDSSSWKTHLCLWEEDLSESSVTLPRWGMMSNGECWERTTLPLLISGTGSGCWRSPAAQEPGVRPERLVCKDGSPAKIGKRAYDKHTGRLAQIGLTQQVKMVQQNPAMIPTPTSSDSSCGNVLNDTTKFIQTGTGNLRKVSNNGVTGSIGLARYVKIWPTPRVGGEECAATVEARKGEGSAKTHNLLAAIQVAESENVKNNRYATPCVSDAKDRGNLSNPCIQRRMEIGKQVQLSMSVSYDSGSLNPFWEEWLMGWPIGWTDLAPLPVGNFERWLQLSCDEWFAVDPADLNESDEGYLPRVCKGFPARASRVKCLGNGQVPYCIEEFFTAISN